MSFTPGPWAIRHSRDGSGDVGIAANGVANVIAECFAAMRSSGENARDEAMANARLIAAAPDLLAAALLFEAAEEFHANCDECNGEEVPELCPKCFPLFDDARIKRRAALSKAEGHIGQELAPDPERDSAQ